jgi:aminoglycoside 3-N-acetyltransferase
MPAYVSGNRIIDKVEFDVDKSHSIAGLLPELFRRMPGVIRSANIAHSVCALGPHAAFLLDSHHLGRSAWDKYSPYFRIGSLNESWIVGVGVGHGLRIVTSLHCVESILSDHPYFKRLFKKEVSYSFVSSRLGSGSGRVKIPSSVILPEKLKKHFQGKLIEETIEGVQIYAIRARDLIESALSLGLKGKTMYVWPIPWRWLFYKSRKLEAKQILDQLFS